MKKYLLLLLTIAYLQQGFAQPKSKKMGEIEPEYLKMTAYEADPNASALILMSEGEITFSDEGIAFIVHKRIKILNKLGLSFANITIPYYADQKLEQVRKLKARSYRLDAAGKTIESKFDEKNLVDEDIDGYYRQKKLFIPNATEGSVIEYSYEVISQRYGAFYDWYFQDTEPVLWSEYSICVPFTIDLISLQQGEHNIIKKEENCFNYGASGAGYHWIAEKLPAMRTEPYINNVKDYMSRLLVRIKTIRFPGQVPIVVISDWEKASTDLLQSEYFGERLSLLVSPELHKIAKDLTDNAPDNKAKIKAIYNYVHSQMTWDGNDGIYPTIRQSLKKAHDLHKGNAADINLLLTYMLRAADLDADPVLCSTLGNGAPVPMYPTAAQFDQVLSLVRIGDEEYLLDATEPLIPYTLLAKKDLNQQVFVLNKKKPHWTPLKAPKTSKNTTLVEANLEANNQLQMSIQKMETNYQAVDMRQAVANLNEAKAVSELFEGTLFPVAIDSFRFSNLSENLEDAVKLKIYCNTELPESGNFTTINYSLHQGFAQNPFKATERLYPVDFVYPREYTYNFILNIPQGYAIETVPDVLKLAFSNDNGLSFTFMTDQTSSGKVQINTKLNINRTFFSSEEYADLRLFFDKVAEKLNETIVLKKM